MAAGLSGVLMAGCYWPLNWHWLGWFALVPWLVVLPRLNAGVAWLLGAILGAVFYRLTLGWMFGLSGPHAGFLIFVLSMLMGFSFCVLNCVVRRLGLWSLVWAAPVCFVGQEILRSEGLPRFRFSYGGWGYSQAHNLWVAQIASLGGVYLVSFLLVGFGAALAYGLLTRTKRSFVPVVGIMVLVVILSLVSQPGIYRGVRVPVACVQEESYDYSDYLRWVDEAFAAEVKPRFVVLPEHTIVDYATENHGFVRDLAARCREYDAYICVGAHTSAALGAKCLFDNVAMTIDPCGVIVQEQSKAVPIPFFRDGNPAEQQGVFDTRWGKVGTYVCYDGGFTDVAWRVASLGAELILVPVMNPIEWPYQQRRQQMDMAKFRSIETRRCIVRAASSGVSQIVDSRGVVLGCRTEAEGSGVLSGQVYFSDELSVFVRWGYWFGPVVAWCFLVLVVLVCVVAGVSRIVARRCRHG
ncbi:MAG: hypothetical protein JW936_11430 [Sedimentisphaerales bacterium]|nr:hypothetical protein [Sedimentisphaerales bacterium]